MALTRPIWEISLEDVLAEGAESQRAPEEIADAVQRWRSLTQEEAAKKYWETDADRWTQGTVKLNRKVGETLFALRTQATLRNLAAMYPTEADRAWSAYKDAGYSAANADALGQYASGLRVLEQEMEHPRWRVASPAATLRAGIPIKAGDDVSLADGSMVEAPILATYQLHRTGGGEEAFLRITDPETGLPRESGGYRIPVPEFDQQTLATMAQQAVTASQAAAARAQQLQAAGEELPVGSVAASYGVHSAQKAALAEAQLQAARAQQLSGPQALAFAQHEAVIERAKSQEAIKTKIGDESAWSRLTDSRGGFITGLATALGPVGRFFGRVRGLVDEDAAEGVRMTEENIAAGRAPFEGMSTAMQRLEPGNTRRQFEGGWWNEIVVASQESVGQMIPALLLGGGIAKSVGMSAGSLAFEAVAVSPLAVSAAGKKYNAVLEEAHSIAMTDPDRSARMRQNALTDAVLTGIIEGGTEMLIPTIGASVSRGMRGFVRRLPSTMGKEALEEVPAQVGENLTDNYLLDAQKTLLEGVPTAMASAGMAAAGMSGGAALVGSFSRRSQVSATPPGGAWPSANPQPVRVDTGLTADALGAEGSSPSRGADPIPTSGELPALTPPTSTDPAGTAPESVESLRAQRRRVASGDKPAMLFPGVAAADVAAEFQPTEDDLLVMTDTPAGAVLHPLDIPAQTVRQAAAEDRIGDVLGYGVPSKPKSGTPVTVVQRDQRGEELAAVAVPAAEIGQAASALAAQTQPGDTVTVETPQQTLATRMAAMRPALDATVPAAEGDVIKDFNLSRRQPEPTATEEEIAVSQMVSQPEEDEPPAQPQKTDSGDLIFGYTWDEIKRAQQGGALARRIPAGAEIRKPLATESDWELLERYGEAELRNMQYFGVLDRLENTRMANESNAPDPFRGDFRQPVGRSRPEDIIEFPGGGIVGPSGAKLRSYFWAFTHETALDWEGEEITVRVSDWEQAEQNFDTGRQVVHQFAVEMPDGQIRTVSLESALKLLGYGERTPENKEALADVKSMAKTIRNLAKARLQLAIIEPQANALLQYRQAFESAVQRISRQALPERTLTITGNEYQVMIGDVPAMERFGINWKADAESGAWKQKWLKEDAEWYAQTMARKELGLPPADNSVLGKLDTVRRSIKNIEKGIAGRPPEIQGAGERAAAAGQTATPAMATPPPVASQVPRKKGKNWKPFIGGGRWSLPKNRGSFDVIDALFTIGTRINRLPKNISKTDPLRKTAEYDALRKFQKQALLLYSHTTLPDGSGSSIDAAADAIYRTYPSLLTEPTATALVDALIGAFNERRKIRDRMRQGGNWRLNQEAMEAGYSPSQYREMMAQVKEWERQGKRQDAAFKKANKPDHDDIQVQAGELDIGETILINGTELTVREILPNGDIVLEDGDRFGTQTVTPGFDLFLDKREEDPDEWNAVFEPGAVLRYAQSHGADTNLPASLDIAATLATLAEDPGYQQDYLPGIGGQEQSLLPLRTSPAAPAPAAPAAVSPGARKPGRKPERPGRRIDEGQRYGQFAAGLKADFSRGPRITSVLADMVDGSIPAWSPIGAVVNTPADFALLCQSVRTPLFESVKVAVVNQKNEIMHAQILTVGSVNQTMLDPRDVLRAIQTARAMKGRGRVEGVIISHNHPSGRVEPSDADRAMTTKVKDLLAKAGGVPLLDHIITNGQEFYSFRTYGKGQISQTNQPAWEVHPAAQRITVDTRDQFDFVIRLLRQDAGQEHGHVIYLDTRLGVIAVERTALATADDIMEHMQQTASMLGASSVALDVPHLLTSEVQRLLAASLTLGNAAAARLVDMSTLSVPSYNASGLMREEDPSYSAPGFLREEDPSYSATHPVGPEWRQNIFGQKVAVDPRIRQSWRQTFSPQFYATFTEAGLAKTVKGWIAENGGIEGATALFMDDASGLRDYEVNALGQQLALAWEQRAARQERRGENPSDAEQTLDAIIVRLERQATQAGQALRAFGMWAKFSPRGIIRKIQRQAAEAREADVLESVGKSAEQLVAAVNATDLTQRTDEENEILRLWNLMMADGPTDRGLAIARTLKLLLPQRVDYRQRIDARHVQAAFRQRMTARGGDGLVRKFWQLMAGPQPGPGALAFFDAATQETLTDLLNRAVKNAGLDSQHSQTNQPTDVEKLAAQLSADPLRWEKVQAAVIAMEAEIDALPETRTVIRQVNGQEQSVLVTREMIRAAWEEATADMDVVLGGPSMLRRMIRSELASRKITQQTWAGLFAKGQPPDAAAASLRQQTVNAILAQVRGKMTSGTDTLTLGDELGAAFDEVAKERFAAWMVDRENRHRAAKQAERRNAFMAALRPKMQTQAATDKLDAIFAAAVVGGPQTAGTPTEDNPLLALLRKHLHTDVPDFLRIAEQLGVPRDVAEEYDAAVQWHRQRAAERAVRLEQDRLIAQLEPRSKKARDAMPRLLRILLEARSNGAIRRPEFLEAYAAVMGLPRFTPELSATIRHLAARVQAAPAGSWIRQSAVADLMAALARWEGVKTSEVMTSFWYANILSGIGTHLVNVSSTAAHLAMRIATTLASAHPRHWINFARGLVAGAAKGTRNAAAAFWHGEPVMKGEELFTKQDVLEVLWSSQPNTVAQTILKYGAASWGRYVFRALSAADAFFYHTAAEGRAWLDASRRSGGQAKAILGLDASSIASAREQALLDLEQAQIPATAAHIDRRTMEIMESRRSAEISGAARHFGGQVTFNYSPQGTLGAIAEGLNHVIRQVPIIRAAVPFTRIVANLGEMSLDWTGYGMVRGALGMHTSTAMRQMVGGKIDPKQRFGVRERIERSLAGAIGVAGAAAIYALARSKKDDDDAAVTFMLYGGGPADATRRSQMPKGWRPFTVKIGEHYVSYAETPLSLVLSAFGTALDQERYGSKLDRGEGGARAMALIAGMGKSFSRMGVLSSLDQLFGIMDGKGSPKALAARTVSGFIPGQAFLRDLAKALDPQKVDTATFAAILMQNIPVLRSQAGRVYNVFGDAVSEPGPWLVSRIVTGLDKSDAEAVFLTTHGLHIPELDQELVIGAYLTPNDLRRASRISQTDRTALVEQIRKGYVTPEQRQQILLASGPKIRKAVAALAKENAIKPIPPTTLRSRLNAAVRTIRREAMADLIGLR